ncbi:MAG: ORC1-type DNA replication protein [Thermoplasmata archaeon]|jgi:cell division control protein 6|nr:ORC1-type DNA replication protein [Thermoplasmata archaeon]
MTEPNIFTQYLDKRNSLVKNKKILQSSYIPENLPHRDDKINEIAEIIAPSLNNDKPSNILIIGKTGTGKTAVMTYIGKELKKADPEEEKCSFIMINCEIVDTPYGILYNIANQIISDPARNIPFTGWSSEKILSELTSYIDEKNKIFIIVLDEIDRSFQKNGDDIFYYLTSINDKLQNSTVAIIGITNNTKFTDFLGPRIKSRLTEEKIVFPPYNVTQLQDILYDRAKEAFEDGILGEGVIPYCAAITAQEGGDARRALHLLRMSADIAERNGDTSITEAHVKSAKNKIEMDAVSEVVKTLNAQSKMVLMSIIKNTEDGKNVMITGDVYSTYKYLCEVTGTSVITQRRVADLISELDMLGIVHARVKSFGRAGRTKEIELSAPMNIINLLKSDELFKELENYKPPKQTTLI